MSRGEQSSTEQAVREAERPAGRTGEFFPCAAARPRRTGVPETDAVGARIGGKRCTYIGSQGCLRAAPSAYFLIRFAQRLLFSAALTRARTADDNFLDLLVLNRG